MAPPRRGPRTQPRPSPRRLSSLFFMVGCLVVLVVMFALGVAAGRRWPNGLPVPGLGGAGVATAPVATATAPAPVAVTTGAGANGTTRGERDAARRPEGRSFDKDKVKTTGGGPVLTFYHELTAPLAPIPPHARPAGKPEARTPEVATVAPRPTDTTKPVAPDAATVVASPREPVASPVSIGASPTAEPRFTVQVGAFKARSQAEALRGRLAGNGQEAYVTEVETGGVTQYRVRVGSFATRDAARDAAAQLGAERQLATYVTTR
jgi:cell division septation protein DedD